MVVTGCLNGLFEIPPIVENTLSKPIPQNFSIPSGIIHYITHTPSSSKGYKKMLQTCKYFMFKKFIFIVDNFYVKDESNDILLDYLTKIDALSENLMHKLWLKRLLCLVIDNDQNVMSRLLRNTFRCTLIDVTVSHQTFTFNEYLMLVEGGAMKEICFYSVMVKYNDGKVVPLECLMEMIPNAVQLKFSYTETPESAITFKTAENLTNLPKFDKLRHLTIFDNYPRFNAIHLCDFIKKNGGDFSLTVRATIVNEDWFKTIEKGLENCDFVVKKFDAETMLPYSKSNDIHSLTTIDISKEK